MAFSIWVDKRPRKLNSVSLTPGPSRCHFPILPMRQSRKPFGASSPISCFPARISQRRSIRAPALPSVLLRRSFNSTDGEAAARMARERNGIGIDASSASVAIFDSDRVWLGPKAALVNRDPTGSAVGIDSFNPQPKAQASIGVLPSTRQRLRRRIKRGVNYAEAIAPRQRVCPPYPLPLIRSLAGTRLVGYLDGVGYPWSYTLFAGYDL